MNILYSFHSVSYENLYVPTISGLLTDLEQVVFPFADVLEQCQHARRVSRVVQLKSTISSLKCKELTEIGPVILMSAVHIIICQTIKRKENETIKTVKQNKNHNSTNQIQSISQIGSNETKTQRVSMIKCDSIRHDTLRCNKIRAGAICYNAVQNKMIWHCTIQHCTMPYNTTRCGAVRCGALRDDRCNTTR